MRSSDKTIAIPSVAGVVEDAGKFSADEKKKITDKLGDIATLAVILNRVWIAIWVRPEAKDLGNGRKLYRSDNTREEDVYQGNVGLVIKKGPLAFKSDEVQSFEGSEVNVGDWVIYNRHAAGLRFTHNGVHCIILDREDPIKGVLTRPDLVE